MDSVADLVSPCICTAKACVAVEACPTVLNDSSSMMCLQANSMREKSLSRRDELGAVLIGVHQSDRAMEQVQHPSRQMLTAVLDARASSLLASDTPQRIAELRKLSNGTVHTSERPCNYAHYQARPRLASSEGIELSIHSLTATPFGARTFSFGTAAGENSPITSRQKQLLRTASRRVAPWDGPSRAHKRARARSSHHCWYPPPHVSATHCTTPQHMSSFRDGVVPDSLASGGHLEGDEGS